ncbi:hypothetical protein [Terriglobus albidus]|nr:hypothetical protein [Terriglobus albidus]
MPVARYQLPKYGMGKIGIFDTPAKATHGGLAHSQLATRFSPDQLP